MRTQFYDEEQVARIIDLRRQGFSMALIGKNVGMTKGAVIGLMDRLAKKGHVLPDVKTVATLNTDRGGWEGYSDHQTDMMIAMLRRPQGATIHEILRVVGGTTPNLARFVAKLGSNDASLPRFVHQSRRVKSSGPKKLLSSPKSFLSRKNNLIPPDRSEVDRLIREAVAKGRVTRLKPGYAYGVHPSDHYGLLTMAYR